MSDHEYDAAAIRFLADMEPPRRDPSDPVVRWVADFLDCPLLAASPESLPEHDQAYCTGKMPTTPSRRSTVSR